MTDLLSRITSEKIATGSSQLDALIGGGLEPQIITQIYGEPASGKSTFALMAAVSVLKRGKKVVIIDTEGFSAERFIQICGSQEEAERLAHNIELSEPSDFAEQGLVVNDCVNACASGDVGLIVLDSATALYRVELGTQGEGQKKLGRQMVILLGCAKKYNIPVLVTNQVFTDVDTDKLTGLGGTALKHISKVIVRVEKYQGHRRAVLEKHMSKAEGASFEYSIAETGTVPYNG